MNCSKKLILSGFRVQYVDLRESKPRTPKEEVYVMDRQWLDALSTLGIAPSDSIKIRYENGGYKVFGIEPIRPKRIADLDLHRLWESAELPATEKNVVEVEK